MLKFSLKGIPAMLGRVRTVEGRIPDRIALALELVANEEIEESKRRVPVDTGYLKSTAYVDPAKRNWLGHYSIELGYTAPYAIYVHEDLEATHKVGEAKFLESVLNESAPHIKDRVAQRLNFDNE